MHITAVEITRRRTASTAAADNIATLSKLPGRGRFHFLKIRTDDSTQHVHAGYVEEMVDCVRLFDAHWNHVGTATTLTDAIAVAVLQAGRLLMPEEMPTIVIHQQKRKTR